MTLEYQKSTETVNISRLSRYASSDVFNAGGSLILNTFDVSLYSSTGDEQYYEVKSEDENRLELIAYKLYGDATLWWLLAYANGIIDPFTEISIGTRLLIPRKEEVFNI